MSFAQVGDPSSGKTTLLSFIASGQIKDFPKHLFVHHCKELGLTKEPVSVLEAVVLSHEFRNVLLACRKELKDRIEVTEDDDDDMEKLKNNLEFVEFQLTKIASGLFALSLFFLRFPCAYRFVSSCFAVHRPGVREGRQDASRAGLR